MLRLVIALVVAGVAGLVAAYAILTNSYPHEGPSVPIGHGHGIHEGDVLIVGAWLLLAVALAGWVAWGARTARR